MKIAINCSYYGFKGGGIKEYIYNLVSNLNKLLKETDSVVCYIPKDQIEYWVSTMPKNISYKCTPYTTKQSIKRSLLQQFFWKKEEQIEKFDVFHSPFFYSPNFKRAKVVITVHDLRFMVYPETYKFLRKLYLKYKVPRALKKADAIIAISQFTKNEIVKYFSISEEKITVILEAVNTEKFSKNSLEYTENIAEKGISKNNYILAVGHIEPRKNYIRLVKAFDLLIQKKNLDLKLVIVGKMNYKTDLIMKAISESPNVIHLGWVEFKELLWLYSNCIFHVFPSIYEGFGFPTLEAAVFGKTTLGSNISSIPEIGKNSAIYFDPFSVDDILEKIEFGIDNPECINEMSKISLKNLKCFSWKQNAIDTYTVYNFCYNKFKE